MTQKSARTSKIQKIMTKKQAICDLSVKLRRHQNKFKTFLQKMQQDLEHKEQDILVRLQAQKKGMK